jgi:hypothetical protein
LIAKVMTADRINYTWDCLDELFLLHDVGYPIYILLRPMPPSAPLRRLLLPGQIDKIEIVILKGMPDSLAYTRVLMPSRLHVAAAFMMCKPCLGGLAVPSSVCSLAV